MFIPHLQQYAEQCEAERLAAQITEDVLSIPEMDDLYGVYGRQPVYIGDDGDPHFIPMEA